MSVTLKVVRNIFGRTIYTATITKNIGFIIHCEQCEKLSLVAGTLSISESEDRRRSVKRATEEKIIEYISYRVKAKYQQAIKDIHEKLELAVYYDVFFGEHDRCMHCGYKPSWIIMIRRVIDIRRWLIYVRRTLIVAIIGVILSAYLISKDTGNLLFAGFIIGNIMIAVLRAVVRVIAAKKLRGQIELMKIKPVLVADIDQRLEELRAHKRIATDKR